MTASDFGDGPEFGFLKRASAHHLNIYVVDDDPEVRDLVRRILEKDEKGVYRVFEATDGYELLRVIDGDVDLVLLDIGLPGLDGIQACKHVKRSSKLDRNIPVIMITARSDAASVVRAMRSGADDYIVKPFDAETLLEKIKKQLPGGAS